MQIVASRQARDREVWECTGMGRETRRRAADVVACSMQSLKTCLPSRAEVCQVGGLQKGQSWYIRPFLAFWRWFHVNRCRPSADSLFACPCLLAPGRCRLLGPEATSDMAFSGSRAKRSFSSSTRPMSSASLSSEDCRRENLLASHKRFSMPSTCCYSNIPSYSGA